MYPPLTPVRPELDPPSKKDRLNFLDGIEIPYAFGTASITNIQKKHFGVTYKNRSDQVAKKILIEFKENKRGNFSLLLKPRIYKEVNDLFRCPKKPLKELKELLKKFHLTIYKFGQVGKCCSLPQIPETIGILLEFLNEFNYFRREYLIPESLKEKTADEQLFEEFRQTIKEAGFKDLKEVKRLKSDPHIFAGEIEGAVVAIDLMVYQNTLRLSVWDDIETWGMDDKEEYIAERMTELEGIIRRLNFKGYTFEELIFDTPKCPYNELPRLLKEVREILGLWCPWEIEEDS